MSVRILLFYSSCLLQLSLLFMTYYGFKLKQKSKFPNGVTVRLFRNNKKAVENAKKREGACIFCLTRQ